LELRTHELRTINARTTKTQTCNTQTRATKPTIAQHITYLDERGKVGN